MQNFINRWILSTNHKDMGSLGINIISFFWKILNFLVSLKKKFKLYPLFPFLSHSKPLLVLQILAAIPVLAMSFPTAECTGRGSVISIFKKGILPEVSKKTTKAHTETASVIPAPKPTITPEQNTATEHNNPGPGLVQNKEDTSVLKKVTSKFAKYINTPNGSYPPAGGAKHPLVTETLCDESAENTCATIDNCNKNCTSKIYAHLTSSKNSQEIAEKEGSTYFRLSTFMKKDSFPPDTDKIPGAVRWAGDGVEATGSIHKFKKDILSADESLLRELAEHSPMALIKQASQKKNEIIDKDEID